MKEVELLENKTEREKLIERTEVLDKVKKVILLPYGECMTRKQVAEYYEVQEETIKKLATRHKEELISNGMTQLEKDNLIDFKSHFDGETLSLTKLNKANRVLNIFTRRAILNVGMLLDDDGIARQIRSSLLNMSENKESMKEESEKIDKEKLLMLDIMCAKDDMEQMSAMNKYKRYKDELQAKIKEEKDVAVGKVENLTKSDATFGIREAKTNLGVGEKKLITYLIENKYCYRQHKKTDEKGKATGKLKAYEPYTKEPTRYFTEIKQLDRLGNPHSQMVITVDGVEHLREFKEVIGK